MKAPRFCLIASPSPRLDSAKAPSIDSAHLRQLHELRAVPQLCQLARQGFFFFLALVVGAVVAVQAVLHHLGLALDAPMETFRFRFGR